MKKRRVLMLLSIVLLLFFYIPAQFQGMRLFDIMEVAYKSSLYSGFVRLCMWKWSGIPLVLMGLAGSMLLSLFFLDFHPQKKYQKILMHIAVTLYTLLMVPVMFCNLYINEVLYTSKVYVFLISLPVLGNLMLLFKPIRYVISALSGGLLIWGLIICIVNYTHGAYAFDYFAACMLIPHVLLLRGLLCPNSRIASVAAVAVTGWSVYFIAVEFIVQMFRPLSVNIFLFIHIIAMVAVALSLICLIIDTVMVFLSHRKAAIPAATGDPPAPAEA